MGWDNQVATDFRRTQALVNRWQRPFAYGFIAVASLGAWAAIIWIAQSVL